MPAGATAERRKRPFWMHQLAEYLLGGVLVAQGLQSPTPAMPAIAGGLILVNAAIVRGSLSAFRVVGRSTHRVLDVVVIAVVLAFAALPTFDIESTTRVVMAAIALVMAFIWWQTSYAERTRTRAPISAEGGRSTEVGRLAGRAVGDGVNMIRRLRKR
ncbi:MAG: hypothetical protein AB7R77_23650 [Ilumatobacteraceae bacterium]